MKWKAGAETAERGYKFAYDGLNRMASAYYGEGSALTASSNRYNELPTYDKMGNITTLQRQGKQDSGYGLIDDLTYTYTGNQLIKVTDAVSGPLYNGAFHFMDGADVATEYVYDKNGNLTKDYNKKIVDIQYNALNLPDALQFTNGNTTSYAYDAAGAKLSVTYQTAAAGITIPMTSVMTPLATTNILATTTTDYCGNVIYENGAVSRILTEEGYITLSGATPTYHYYLKDHQGNNRVVLSQTGAVEQVNHDYPFGGLFGESTNSATQPYKYNGKELDRMHGLDLFDYGARHYDATLGRWFAVDPMAEEYYQISPYAYTANNPINLIDIDGMMFGDYYNRNGFWLGQDRFDDNKVYLADAVNKDTRGLVTEASNKQELSISHDNFQTISGIVKQEAGTSNANENLWIAHTANNAAVESGMSLYDKLMSGYSSVPHEAKRPLSSLSNNAGSNSARAAVLNVLTGNADPTKGATLWDGTDFIAWGLNSPYGTPHAKFRQYNNISISDNIYGSYLKNTLNKYPNGSVRYQENYYSIPATVFRDKSNWINGRFYYDTGYRRTYGIQATGAFGHSIFWKKVK